MALLVSASPFVVEAVVELVGLVCTADQGCRELACGASAEVNRLALGGRASRRLIEGDAEVDGVEGSVGVGTLVPTVQVRPNEFDGQVDGFAVPLCVNFPAAWTGLAPRAMSLDGRCVRWTWAGAEVCTMADELYHRFIAARWISVS